MARLFGIKCAACEIQEKWIADKTADIERQRLIYEARISHLESELHNSQDREHNLQETILKFTRVIPSEHIRSVNESQPVRIGNKWTGIKAKLEEEARVKADYWRKRAQEEVIPAKEEVKS